MLTKSDTPEIIIKCAVALLFAAILFQLTVPISDPDFWWHLASGRWMAEHGKLLDHDPFSIMFPFQEPTLNRDFILKQYWLSQILFYAIYVTTGFKGIIVFCAAVFTAMFFVLYRLMRMSGVGRMLALPAVYLASLVVVNEFGYIGTRPQMWSSLFTVLILYGMEMLRQNRRWASYAVPGLMLLWSNMHGGYILGDIIILIYTAGALLFHTGSRTLYMTAAGALLCSGINPNGYIAFISAPFIAPLLTSLHLASQQQVKSLMDSIVETQSIFEHASVSGIMRSLPFFTGLIVLSLISFAINIRNLRAIRKDHLLLYLLVVLMGLRSIRFIIFFVTVASFITALNLKLFFENRSFPKFLSSRAMIFCATLLMVLAISISAVRAGINYSALGSDTTTVSDYEGAVQFMQQTHLQGNLFNDYTVGGYLIWQLTPEVKVFIDGRALSRTAFEIFRVTVDHPDTFVSGPDLPYYQYALNSFTINMVLISGCDKVSGTLIKLAPALIDDTGWALIYADRNSLLFMRNIPEYKDFLQQYSLPKSLAYKNIMTLATEASQSGHARMMQNWKLSLAVADAGLGDLTEARRLIDDYVRRVPSDGYAVALQEKWNKRTP